MHGVSHTDEALASLLLRVADVQLTAVSDATASGLLRYRWAPDVEILDPGVDVDQLRADSADGGPVELIGEPSLCCVARQEHQKGIDVLLQTLAIVADDLPEGGSDARRRG